VDGQQHSADPDPSESTAADTTSPITVPPGGQRPSRAAAVRRTVTSRGAGWVVATALAGAVIALSATLAAQSPAAVVLPGGGPRAFVVGPGGGPRGIVVGPGGVARAFVVGPGAVPPGQQVPAWLRALVPYSGPAAVHLKITGGPSVSWVVPPGTQVYGGPAAPFPVRVFGPACHGPVRVLMPGMPLPGRVQIVSPAGPPAPGAPKQIIIKVPAVVIKGRPGGPTPQVVRIPPRLIPVC